MPRNKKPAEVPIRQLRWRCDPKIFPFKNTTKADPLDGILGQSRALEAIDVGLHLKSPGYNIYVAGLSGTGKTTTVRTLLDGLVGRNGDLPEDIVYLNNFKDEAQPRAVKLPAGFGRTLKKEMTELVSDLRRFVPAMLQNNDFKKKRGEIIEKHKQAQHKIYSTLEKDLRKEEFGLVQVQLGPATQPAIMPLIEGQPVGFEQLDQIADEGNFPAEKLAALKKKQMEFNDRLEETMRSSRAIEKKLKDDLADLEKKMGLATVPGMINDIRERLKCPNLNDYFSEVQEAIVSDLSRFKETSEQAPPIMIPGLEIMAQADEFIEFKVNIAVDNKDTKGLPVIIENSPNHKNLFGTIERIQRNNGVWVTDFTKIRSGSLLRANGGFLVINLLDAITEPGVWKTLKRTLKSRCMESDAFDPFFLFAASAIKPQSVPVDLKIVAIGDNMLYHTLTQIDDEFGKIFKIKADFDSIMNKDAGAILKYAGFVHKIVTDENLLHFNAKAVAALVEEGVRMAGRQKKLTTRFSLLADLIREAHYLAQRDNKRMVTDQYVDRAVVARARRHALIEDRMHESIEDGLVKIDTSGLVVGQINGLAVYSLGDHMFGKPVRITAQVSMGRQGIINIEREAKLSGKTHDKGVLILSGFLRSRYARNKPMALHASVCFEQSYGGVDGDSASSTELYAILSALSGKPLRQDLAVTGSVDQLGRVQTIGGVNEKIEGMFEVCRTRGLTGAQGVLIPKQNVGDLMLRKDVLAAVRKKMFHVYPVETIDEGIEILTGLPAGAPDKDGKYPQGTINALVDRTLVKLARGLTRFGKPAPAVKKKTAEKKSGKSKAKK